MTQTHEHTASSLIEEDQIIADSLRSKIPTGLEIESVITGMLDDPVRELVATPEPGIRSKAAKYIYDAARLTAGWGAIDELTMASEGTSTPVSLPKVPSDSLVNAMIVTGDEAIAQIAVRTRELQQRGARIPENYLVTKALSPDEIVNLPYLDRASESQRSSSPSIFDRLSWLQMKENRPALDKISNPLIPVNVFNDIIQSRDLRAPVMIIEEHYTKTLPPHGIFDIDTRARYLVYARKNPDNSSKEGDYEVLFLDEEQDNPHAHLNDATTHEPFRKEFPDFGPNLLAALNESKIPAPLEPREDRLATNEHLAKILFLYQEAIKPPEFLPAFCES